MINAENAMRQAGFTAEVYMLAAKKAIDESFGEGYSANHPSLVAAFMHVAAKDFDSAMNQDRHEKILNEDGL